MKSLCYLGLFWFLGVTVACGQATVRVAVVGGPGVEELAALLATELSQSPGIDLVERDELAKVGDERRLQEMAGSDATALGKMFGADGLVFLVKAGDGVQVRLTATGLGYALFDDRLSRIEDTPHFAKATAERVAGYAPKLKLSPEEASPISVLNLRADQASREAGRVERQLSLLLESRLAAMPRYVVLERRHASAIQFENILTETERPPLAGVSVVDGTLSLPTDGGDVLTVRLRVRATGKGEAAIEVSGSVKDLPGMAEKMAMAISEKIGTGKEVAAWDAQKEAREYLMEGVWASQHDVQEAALEALDSAELLGENKADVIAARLPVLCAVAVGSSRIITGDMITAPDPNPERRVTAMFRAFNDELRYEREDLQSQLQAVQLDKNTMGSDRIRRSMIVRAAASLQKMLDETKSPYADKARESFRAFVGYDPLQGKFPGFPTISIRHVDALSNSIEEEKAYYRHFFEWSPDCVGWRYEQNSNYPGEFCARFIPNRADRWKEYRGVLQGMLDGRARVSALFNLAKVAPAGGNQDEICDQYFQTLTDQRDELAANGRLIPYLIQAFELERQRGRAEADARLIALERYLLQTADRVEKQSLQTWHPDLFPIADAPGLWKDFQALESKAPGDAWNIERMRRAYVARFGEEKNASALTVDQFWYPIKPPGMPSFAAYSTEVAPDGILVAVNYFGGKPFHSVIYHVVLNEARSGNFKTDDYPMPDFTAQSLVAVQRDLYVIGGSGSDYRKRILRKMDLATRRWEIRDSPPGKRMFEAGGKIYFTLMGLGAGEFEGGIVRMDEKSGVQTILASSRRRPPLNQFDDREAYEVRAIFAGPGGKPCASIGFGEVYEIMDKPGEWPLVIPSGALYFAKTEGLRTLLYGERLGSERKPGDVVFLVDTTKTEPELWLGESSPMYGTRNSGKEMPPLPQPEWAMHPRWEESPPEEGSRREYGFRGEDLFAFVSHQKTLEKELLWYRSGVKNAVRIPLDFRMSAEAEKAVNTAMDKDPLRNRRPPDNPGLEMISAPQGICFLAANKGFWYLPFSEIDAYLKKAAP